MRFAYDTLRGATLDAAMRHYDDRGFIIVDGVEQLITKHFKPIVAERLRVGLPEFEAMLDPSSPPVVLPVEIRERLSRVTTSPELAATLFSALGPVLARLVGPLAHISSNYHAQFKGGEVKPVDHGGYDPKAQYLEVQGQYLIHQDFAGAALPTSPCGVTVWTGLNNCPDWNLRLYPGSHRYGLLCHQWLKLDDPRLQVFGAPIDVESKAGSIVIFNSLLLHSSSNPGPRRRVSCDIRFFPLTGFLPSTVHCLVPKPAAALREGLGRETGITLRAPLLETQAFLGMNVVQSGTASPSLYDWVDFLVNTLAGRLDAADADLKRFVHPTRAVDGVEAYAKFRHHPVAAETLRRAREHIARTEPDAPELGSLDRLMATMPATIPA
jgi:hypothetical protein